MSKVVLKKYILTIRNETDSQFLEGIGVSADIFGLQQNNYKLVKNELVDPLTAATHTYAFKKMG